ncbi:MAG: radical SAM protein, partial [Bacteroidota bacterium]
FASLSRLKILYSEALKYPGIAGLVIGTRPDCVDDSILGYLQELSQKVYIQIEYGIETCHDKTLERINRQHDFGISEKVIRKTSGLGIKTCVHLIFGLPGENQDDMFRSVDIISQLPIDSVKFHQLQIVKGTTVEKEFLACPGDFHLFRLEDYIGFIVKAVETLNPAIVIERFSGEVPPRLLYEPEGSAGGSDREAIRWGLIRYDAVLRLIENEFERQRTWQGRLFRGMSQNKK